jgi:DNA-binding NarL/FixJ family response regulator
VTQGRKKSGPKPEVDRGALALLNQPNRTMSILAMFQLGHRIDHIVRVGEYQQSWDRAVVLQTLAAHGFRAPAPPFGGGAHPGPTALVAHLSEQQLDVLREACTGADLPEIGARLFLTHATVGRVLGSVLTAIGANDRAHAISLVLTGRVRPVLREGGR